MADDGSAERADADGAPLPPEATAVLGEWADSDPPAGFVDRVMTAARQAQAPAAPPRRRWPIAAAVLAVAAAAGSALVVLRGTGGAPEEGARVVAARETIQLGPRGVAVAEPGTELTWTVSPSGDAEVHQTRGDVFYRVEPGGPFIVETPYGRVIVRGTCFRVEVLNMSLSKQAWIGGAVGAALAATIVIGVYEGHVRVVNARGQADAHAGERIALGAGAAPAKLGAAGPTTITAVEPPPPTSATLDELLRRDQSHRGEIALLRARLQTLESNAAAPNEQAAAHHEGKRKIIDLTPDELVDLAKNCEIRFDVPGYGIEPRLLDDKLAAALDLSADERATYDQTVRKENDRYMTALRALYQELGGGDAGNLDAHTLMIEIMQKSPSADVEAARKRVAEERAGLAPPSPAARPQSIVERMFRLETSAGNALERLLAAELGPDKAHQIRKTGWAGGDDAILSGCPD